MKMKFYFILLLFVIANISKAQENYYLISFTNKDTANFTQFIPENFLSKACINRRNKFNIPLLSYSDLPVSKTFIKQVEPYVSEVLQEIKWFNGVIVKAQSTLKDSLKNKEFINGIDLIGIAIKTKMQVFIFKLRGLN